MIDPMYLTLTTTLFPGDFAFLFLISGNGKYDLLQYHPVLERQDALKTNLFYSLKILYESLSASITFSEKL